MWWEANHKQTPVHKPLTKDDGVEEGWTLKSNFEKVVTTESLYTAEAKRSKSLGTSHEMIFLDMSLCKHPASLALLPKPGAVIAVTKVSMRREGLGNRVTEEWSSPQYFFKPTCIYERM